MLKRHVRESKYDPSVEGATLLEANPHYAHVKTVSLRDLPQIGAPVEFVPRTPVLRIEKSVTPTTSEINDIMRVQINVQIHVQINVQVNVQIYVQINVQVNVQIVLKLNRI